MEKNITLKEQYDKAKEDYLSSNEIFYDFCDTFKMEDDIQNNLFNLEFNQPYLRWIFIDPVTGKKNPPFTKDFLNAISTRIYNNSHTNLFIFGPTNSGKSQGAQSVGVYYKKEFFRLKNMNIIYHVVFSDIDMDPIFPILGYGDFLIRDESSDPSGEDTGILKTRINNLIRAIRKHQNSFVFVNPDIIPVPLVDYYLRTAGKKGVYECEECNIEYINLRICPECNSETKIIYSKCQTRFIVYYKQTDPLTTKSSFIPLGRIYLTLHHDKEFRKIYEERKDENIEFLLQTSGLLTKKWDDNKLSEEAQILAKLCREENISTKIGMQVKMIEYNKQFSKNEASRMIGGTPLHNRLLFEKTKQLLKKVQNHEENILVESFIDDNEIENQLDPFEKYKDYTFPYSINDVIKKARGNISDKKKKKFERNLEIYFKSQNGMIYDDIHPQYSDLSGKSNISMIVNEIIGLLSFYKGKMFEKDYITNKLQKIYKDKVIYEGNSGMPDAYVIIEELNELHIFSLKIIDSKYLSREEVKPEQEFGLENRFKYKKVLLFIIAYINNQIFIKCEEDLSLTENIIFK